MKICHLTSGHQNNDIRIFHKECVSLAKAGYETYLVVQGDSFDSDGVHIIGAGMPGGGRLTRMTSFAKNVFNKAAELDADIYHIHDPELLPYALKLKKSGKKVIFDSHENYPAQILEKGYIPKILRRIVSFLYKSYESYVFKQIDAVIVPCKFSGKNIFEGTAKKTVFIDNTPLLAEFYDQYDVRETNPGKAICYTGGLTYDRGTTHLIKAAAKAGVKLILAGKFMPPDYYDEVKAMNEFNNVEYKGYLDRKGILEVYKDSSIGMCTILNVGQYNTGDNFATKVYEYMSCGLPVIITDSAYAREVLKEYRFGLCVQPDDADAISDAIKYLLANPDIAKEMRSEGRRAIREKFNWSIEAKKLIALYEELA